MPVGAKLRVSIKMQKNELRVNFYTRVLNTKLNLTMYFSDNDDIWVSSQIQNAWARLYKIGYLCVMEGAFTVPAGIAIVNLDLFNISNCGIFPSQQASFSLSSFGGGGGIGYINNDGKVIFAIETPGSSEWRFNFSFISTTL